MYSSNLKICVHETIHKGNSWGRYVVYYSIYSYRMYKKRQSIENDKVHTVSINSPDLLLQTYWLVAM
jgi:hypothetical protein